ncbi:hypothetical protein L917_19028 [Phytophthora nicotianae]|uniref:Uncharacterized protein n=1 Tax=Phytophthora nicotianae TaxID=4792 RepID=W2K5P6_PHYNI|nr:hypothetical protein L917_19028 [Phytophthora nicotianae]
MITTVKRDEAFHKEQDDDRNCRGSDLLQTRRAHTAGRVTPTVNDAMGWKCKFSPQQPELKRLLANNAADQS